MFVFVRADEFVLRYHISRFHMVYGCNIIGIVLCFMLRFKFYCLLKNQGEHDSQVILFPG